MDDKRKKYMQDYYQRNKAKVNAQSKKWAAENPEKRKEQALRWARNNKAKTDKYKVDWFENNFEKRLLAQAKRTAKTRGFDFNLTLEDIFIPERCPYLDIELSRTILKGRIPERASIDRIDNNKGYVKGNIQIISSRANRMKNDASLEELVFFAKQVLNLHEKEIR